ncbi:hypothetical protein CO165_03255 [Candidatus Roizmanbacteria bacterium CG_4_9_14_3_um_filter_33_18]|uniref:DUF86 domain-containing protein n=2 Tax=Candidatus Roizmaniibacteriota TaxID=1752723 RepID=A0A2M7UAD8_9BACT|nr:MAG: hypothetical protein COY12_00560 [Candidatus Roizmanbacteria bacterium CG_4_10_14_0_2_um_filter_33_96]PJA55499.1 MAG: hypothetical protein CO165_03255 [Candidatus Roizmanbacteria bacterium CG_4_9_14_3_um_filter_33_18]
MKKDNLLFLKHILVAIEDIEEFIKDTASVEDFVTDKKTHSAILRSFQVIGEATNNLDENFIESNTDVEWEKVIGMRNFIIHEYFGVDLNIVWDTIKEDLPTFKENVKKLLQKSTI